MNWKKVKLGDVCNIEKGKTGILKAIPGEFPLVVTADERKSHNEYQFDGDAVIIPLVSGTGHGHASIKRLHFQSGKFALGSILCAVIPKEKHILNAEYLFRFLILNKDRELVDRMKGMANVTLPIKEIAKIEIFLPSLKEQKEFVNKFSLLENISQNISLEFHRQLDFVKQLRQAFLHEAMQGKLIKSINTNETGQQLLEKIKTEKKQLIADKVLKKEKELPPIGEDEIPFTIPEHWVWCRLGEICNYGNSPKAEPNKFDNDTWVLDLEDIEKETSKLINKIRFKEKNSLSTKSIFKKGEVLYSKLRPYLDKVIVADEDGVCTTEILPLKLFASINPHYLKFALKRSDFLTYVNSVTKGMKMPRLGTINGQMALTPLPPIHEQDQIVNKLNELMNYCDDLENNIKESQIFNDQLLQQVLKEALQPKEEAILNADSLFENKNYDLYVAMMQKLIEKQLHINYGEVATQKTVFHLNTFTDEKIPYSFANSNFGTYSFKLKEDLMKNPYLTKSKIGNGEVFVVKANKEKEIIDALANPKNKSFVEAIKKVLSIYEHLLINKETEKIELLNTVSKVILDKQTTDLEIIYKGMKNWEINQSAFKTKAEKFSKTQTKAMISLIEKLGLVEKLIK